MSRSPECNIYEKTYIGDAMLQMCGKVCGRGGVFLGGEASRKKQSCEMLDESVAWRELDMA